MSSTESDSTQESDPCDNISISSPTIEERRMNMHATRKAISSLVSIRADNGTHLCSGALFTELSAITVATCIYELYAPRFGNINVWYGISFCSANPRFRTITGIGYGKRGEYEMTQKVAVVWVSNQT